MKVLEQHRKILVYGPVLAPSFASMLPVPLPPVGTLWICSWLGMINRNALDRIHPRLLKLPSIAQLRPCVILVQDFQVPGMHSGRVPTHDIALQTSII
jgi:hypothetical protein